MSITDTLMWRYYELCTDVSLQTIEQMKTMVADGQLHPKKAKEGLAMRVVNDFHDEAAARTAREEFERVFRQRGQPDRIPEQRVKAEGGKAFLPRLLVDVGLAKSKSEANRLLKQGGLSIDDTRVAPGTLEVEAGPGEQKLLKLGKRRFVRVTFE
jgi:tyrosyl-tRNA synthetase